MTCPYCGGPVKLYRQINSSGAQVAVERCEVCRRPPVKGRPFISKKSVENYDSLPIFSDYRETAEPCAVCGSTEGTEYHHYSPRHLFGGDADKWPTGYLCPAHHREWHLKTQTGPFWLSRKK